MLNTLTVLLAIQKPTLVNLTNSQEKALRAILVKAREEAVLNGWIGIDVEGSTVKAFGWFDQKAIERGPPDWMIESTKTRLSASGSQKSRELSKKDSFDVDNLVSSYRFVSHKTGMFPHVFMSAISQPDLRRDWHPHVYFRGVMRTPSVLIIVLLSDDGHPLRYTVGHNVQGLHD